MVHDVAPDSILIQVLTMPAKSVQQAIHVQQQMMGQYHTQSSVVMIMKIHQDQATITIIVRQALHTTIIIWLPVHLGIIVMTTQVQGLLLTLLRQSATTESTLTAQVVSTAQLVSFVDSDIVAIRLPSRVVTTHH